jgi:hypothetical protein
MKSEVFEKHAVTPTIRRDTDNPHGSRSFVNHRNDHGPGLVPRLSPRSLATGSTWLSSVYRRECPPSIGNVRKPYSRGGRQPFRPDMFLTKDTSLLLRAAAAATLAVLTLLVVVPCGVLFLSSSPDSALLHLRLLQLSLTCWAAWALVSSWVALDSSRLWRVLGRPVDPLVHRLCGARCSASSISVLGCWL